ncbi:MAG: CoA-binding protein, partial [Acidobacteriota bacterium]|nr:CoA-binding protein [Acidobacteriota bacterium]
VNKELKAKGYRVLPVNPAAESIGGEKCYASLAALPEKVGGVAGVAGIKKRPDGGGEEGTVVGDFVEIPVGEEIVAAERGVAFLSVVEAGIATHPEIGVAIEAKDE